MADADSPKKEKTKKGLKCVRQQVAAARQEESGQGITPNSAFRLSGARYHRRRCCRDKRQTQFASDRDNQRGYGDVISQNIQIDAPASWIDLVKHCERRMC